MATLATLVVDLVGNVGKFNQSMRSAGDTVAEAGRKMAGAGLVMSAGVTVPLAGIGAAAIKAGQDLSEGMANVASLGVATERVNELQVAVQNTAIAVGKGTADMAGGLYQVISAFGDTADTAKILDTNARAAAAGLSTTTEAINLTSAVTKAYGDTSAQAVEQVADLALRTVQLGQTTFPELASSIGRVSPLASNLGVSMAELFGVMATGTGVTGSAAEVSTQLRGILQSLMSPTADMTELFEQLGVTSGEMLIEVYGLEDGLTNIVGAAEASGQPLQKFISSIEGQTLAMALAGPQLDTWAEKTQAMRGAAGTATEAFKAQTEGVNAAGFAMQQAKVQVEVLLQKLYEGLAPAILAVVEAVKPFVARIQEVAQKFADLDPKTQTIIVAVGGLVAAIGPALTILGTLGVAIGALASPIGLIVAAIAGLAAAWATDFGGIRTKTEEIWAVLQPVFSLVVAWLQEKIPQAIAIVAGFWTNTLQPAIETVWRFLDTYVIPLLTSLGEVVFLALQVALIALARVWRETLQPALKIVWEFLDKKLGPAFRTLSEFLKTVFAPAVDFARGAVAGLAGVFEGLMGFLDKVKNGLSGLKDKLLGLKIPEQLVGHSPSPFEMSLRGIADALAMVQQNANLRFSATGFNPPSAPALSSSAAAFQAPGTTINLSMTFNGQADPQAVSAAAELGVRRAAIAAGML